MKKLFTLALAMMLMLAISSGAPPEVVAQDEDPVCEAMATAEKAACDAATQAHFDLLAEKITRKAHDEALDKCMAMKEAMKTCEPE